LYSLGSQNVNLFDSNFTSNSATGTSGNPGNGGNGSTSPEGPEILPAPDTDPFTH